jgi:hypothetical protein
VLHDQFRRRIKDREPSPVRVSDAAIREAPRIIDAAMPGMLEHCGHFPGTIHLDDLIVRREEIAFPAVERRREKEEHEEFNEMRKR